MQESRCFKILYYLVDKGKATAPELAEKFEVSVRTIYRDLDVLSLAGIPIYTNPGKGGGIFIQEHFVLDKVVLSKQEKEQILLALKDYMPVEGVLSQELLTKLGSLFRTKTVDWIEVQHSSWQSETNEQVFNTIKDAIMNQSTLKIQYFSYKESTERKIAPIKLVFKNMDWYLYAFCFLRNDYRFFKLKRMNDLHIENEQYDPKYIIPLPKDTQLGSKLITAKLKFDMNVAYRVYDDFSGLVKEADGYLWVDINLPQDDYITGYLLTFGDALEVVQPLSLRNQIIDKIKKMQLKY